MLCECGGGRKERGAVWRSEERQVESTKVGQSLGVNSGCTECVESVYGSRAVFARGERSVRGAGKRGSGEGMAGGDEKRGREARVAYSVQPQVCGVRCVYVVCVKCSRRKRCVRNDTRRGENDAWQVGGGGDAWREKGQNAHTSSREIARAGVHANTPLPPAGTLPATSGGWEHALTAGGAGTASSPGDRDADTGSTSTRSSLLLAIVRASTPGDTGSGLVCGVVRGK